MLLFNMQLLAYHVFNRQFSNSEEKAKQKSNNLNVSI